MHVFLFVSLGLVVTACRSGKTVDEGTTDTSAEGGEDSDVDLPDVESPTFPVGSWYDCGGRFDLDESERWRWVEAESGCTVSGAVGVEDAVIVLQVPDEDTCGEDLPWWVPGSSSDVRYNHAQSASRLTLIPETAEGATGSTRTTEKHFYLDLERSRWLFENQLGEQSHFDACFTAEGVFFEGGYRAIDTSCNFLSCAGAINEWRRVDAGVQIWTGCSGDCPCAGVLVTEDYSETTMSGSYRGANCATVLEGTYEGTRIDFPAGDAPGR